MCTDKDRSVRREFNRQIDIPQNVDPKSLRSTLTNDGILQVRIDTFYTDYRSVSRDFRIIAYMTFRRRNNCIKTAFHDTDILADILASCHCVVHIR